MAFKQQVTPITQKSQSESTVAGNIITQLVTSKAAGAVKVPSKIYHINSDAAETEDPAPTKFWGAIIGAATEMIGDNKKREMDWKKQ